MIISQKIKEKLYPVNRILFYWSVIFFLVLVIFEDLKKSIVSAHFMPHIFIMLIFLFGMMTFVFSENKVKPEKKYVIKKTDKILAIISGVICAGLYLLFIKNISYVTVLIMILIIILVYFLIVYMFKEFEKKE